jgi:hypothetical protein
VYRVSRALHLDYKNLKRRQQEQAGGALGTTGNETRFVELTVSPARWHRVRHFGKRCMNQDRCAGLVAW